MPSTILPASLPIFRPSNQSLSSCSVLAGPNFFRPFSLSPFSFPANGDLATPSIIRMGGGPRTFPGGVSKWQWKRMQEKKAKQLLKARLCRERQLYEMRKRAELKAAISELERPWEVVERAPVLFSASADEQVKVLADRFQRPTGFDMWSERDGPQLFRSSDDLPSTRFFPKGAVHHVKPYRAVAGDVPDGGVDSDESDEKLRYNDWIARGAGGIGRGRRVRGALTGSTSSEKVMSSPGKFGDGDIGENRSPYSSGSDALLAESREEEDTSGAFNQLSHGSEGSGKELGVTGSRLTIDEMVGEFGQSDGRSRGFNLFDSEHALTYSTMEEHEMAGRTRDRGSHGLDSELIATRSWMEGPQISSGFDRRGGRGSRGGRGGRGGRNVSRNSYSSYSALLGAGSRMEGNVVVGDRRGVRDHNGISHVSDSEIGFGGSRMNDHDVGGSFGRRGGGRGGRGRFRASYRSFSELEIDDSRTEGHMADDFDRHGNRGRSRDPRSFDSERVVTGSRTEEDGNAGGFHVRGGRGRSFRNRGSYQSYSSGSRVKGNVMANGSGRRGGYRGSYGSDSELTLPSSRKTTEMAGSYGRYSGGRGYKNTGRVSLRPTTELRLEEGGRESGGSRWNEARNGGFSANWRTSRQRGL